MRCRPSRPVVSAAALAVIVAAWGTGAAAADTIHLKNGRVIHSVEATIEGGQVVFWQFGARQAIPLSVVEKVVDDDRREPVASGAAPRGAGAGPAASGAGPGGSGGAPLSGDASGVEGLGGLDLATLAGLAGLAGGGTGGAGADPGAALGALRSLGADGILPLADRLGALGDAGGDVGELGRILEIVPTLRGLGEILATDDPSPERTAAVVGDLLRSLSEMGVTEEMIRAEAARLGISLDGFTFPGR